jgi:hypothetical protein
VNTTFRKLGVSVGSRGPGFDSRALKKGSGSGTGSTQPVSTTEELLDRKVAAPV